MAFYVDDLDDLAERLEAAGVRITDAGSGTTVFCHPKDTPGMLEFHPASGGSWEQIDPRFRPEWDVVPPGLLGHHPLGALRMSHITVVTGDLDAAEQLYVDVLDARPAPRSGGDRRRRHLAPLPRGRGHRGRDDGPRAAPTSIAARDLARVGPSVTGVTFTVHDLATAGRMDGATSSTPIAEVTEARDPARRRTHVGLRVPLHRAGAHGRPARVIAAAIVGCSSATQSRVPVGGCARATSSSVMP